ncbi:MAG: MarR family transcriptional regulator [Spirochaetales bacterium]|nr:MarR family transcriptional regulator [Spirochaetales bacterium]
MNENSAELLSTVAALYYLDGLTQEAIASKVNISRSAISRILKRAREKGIVQIRITCPSRQNGYLERKLKDAFGIEAIVINSDCIDDAVLLDEIRRRLIEEMKSLIKPDSIVGVSRAAIFHDICSLLKYEDKNVSFAQVMGMEALGARYRFAFDIVAKLSNLHGGIPLFLDAPLVFESKGARESLKRVPTIARTLDALKKADLLMTSIPMQAPGKRDHIWQGFISDEEYQSLLDMNAVGAMFGRAFDMDGRFLDVSINENIVGIDLETVMGIDTLAVCYGKDFSKAALGGLRTKLINKLITDTACAEGILELAKEEE